MKKVALSVSLLVCFLTLACSKQEQSQPPEVKKSEPAPVAAVEKAVEKVEQVVAKTEQAATAMVEKSAEVAAAVAPQTEEKVAVAAATTESAVQAVADKAVEVAQAPTAAVEQAVETGKEAVAGAVAGLAGAAVAIEQQAVAKVEAVVAPAAVPAAATASESVVFEAKNGNVTLTHKIHGDTFGCVFCHGDGTPGALTLGKDKAHALCKGCHQEKAAGPTKCAGCHVKA